MNNGNEYNIIITEGFVFKYLEGLKQSNNPFTFNIKRILETDSGLYIISINEEHNWNVLH